MLHTKFQFIWPSGFRGEKILVLASPLSTLHQVVRERFGGME
jgi:hypothetical protein